MKRYDTNHEDGFDIDSTLSFVDNFTTSEITNGFISTRENEILNNYSSISSEINPYHDTGIHSFINMNIQTNESEKISSTIESLPLFDMKLNPITPTPTTETQFFIPSRSFSLESSDETASSTSSETTLIRPIQETSMNSIINTSTTSRRNRKRQKDEIAHLRSQVYHLEEQLKNLKPSTASIDTNIQDQTKMTATIAWEYIAKGQNMEKQKVIAENTKLKNILEDQLKLTRSLKRLFKRQPDAALFDYPIKRFRQLNLNEEETQIFHSLQENLDTRFTKTEAIMKSTNLINRNCNYQDAHARYEANRGLEIEGIDCAVFPFSLKELNDAVWGCIKQPFIKLSNGHYSFRSESNNTVNGIYEMTLQSRRGSSAKCKKYMTTRRYCLENRIVFVYEGSMIMTGDLVGSTPMKLRDLGWFVLDKREWTKEDLKQVKKETSGSICRLCVRISPDPSHNQELPTGVLTDLLVSSFQSNFGIMKQTSENILLENALKREQGKDNLGVMEQKSENILLENALKQELGNDNYDEKYFHQILK